MEQDKGSPKVTLSENQRTVLKNLELLDSKVADIREAITKGRPMTLGRQNLLASILLSLRNVAGSW